MAPVASRKQLGFAGIALALVSVALLAQRGLAGVPDPIESIGTGANGFVKFIPVPAYEVNCVDVCTYAETVFPGDPSRPGPEEMFGPFAAIANGLSCATAWPYIGIATSVDSAFNGIPISTSTGSSPFQVTLAPNELSALAGKVRLNATRCRQLDYSSTFFDAIDVFEVLRQSEIGCYYKTLGNKACCCYEQKVVIGGNRRKDRRLASGSRKHLSAPADK